MRAVMSARPATGAPVRLVSVVLPAKNGAATIGEQLEALADQGFTDDWEVIVVDNGSQDGTVQVAERFAGRIPCLRVVTAAERAGVCYARNAGARAARGDVLLFVDQDDRVAPGWLAAMACATREHGAAGGNTVGFLMSSDGPDVPITPGYVDHPRHSFDFLPSITGGNSGMTADLFWELGGWNEDYDPEGAEDVDLYWRAHLAGHPPAFVPGALLMYRSRASLRALLRQSYRDGTTHPHLYRDFRAAGMPPSSVAGAARAWLRLVWRLPRALRTDEGRRAWVTDLGQQAGRIVGSVRFRTLYL